MDPPVQMQALLDELETRLAERTAASPESTIAIRELRGAAARKATLMEDFKSHNAVLRNSLSFLTTAADEALLEVAAQQARGIDKTRLRERFDKTLLDSIVFSRSGAADQAPGARRIALSDALRTPGRSAADTWPRLALFENRWSRRSSPPCLCEGRVALPLVIRQ